MHARWAPRLLAAVALLALAGAAWLALAQPDRWQGVTERLNLLRPAATEEGRIIRASGAIEAEEGIVSPELGGRVLKLHIQEGQVVQAGDVVAELDRGVLLAQLERALAAQRVAEANLLAVSAGPRETVVRRAEAALAQAQAQHEGVLSLWWNAAAIRANPQELDAQIDEARTQVKLAEEQLSLAQIQVKAAEIVRDRYQGDGSLEGKARYEIESQRVVAAEAQVEAARRGAQAARATLSLLQEVRANPVALEVQVRSAQAQAGVARAGVRLAETGVALAQAGPRPEEVEMAAAQVEQARAAVRLAQAQVAKQTLHAPVGGAVSTLTVREGEVALPGSVVARVAHLEMVELVIYVPQTQVGWVRLGQEAEVTVDSFPGRVFLGQVAHISPEAEFTPRNVQTQEERVKMVFAVTIRLANPGHTLKPGMPADAVIRAD